MPAPDKSLYTQLTKLAFVAKAIVLPENWKSPGAQFPQAFQAVELAVPPPAPMNLFKAATLNKYHVDAANQIGQKFEGYIQGICGAICDAIGQWQSQATISNVIINGPVGVLMPGGVTGPPLGQLILASAPMGTPQETKYSQAVAAGFGPAWLAWHMGMMGTLMYPAFAAFPGPMAPPMPNIPIPVIALPSPGAALLAPPTLKQVMAAAYGDASVGHAEPLFDCLCTAFAPLFAMFLATNQVKNVLGTGPIPTFAPPFVPVGPVVMGMGTGAPGCLA